MESTASIGTPWMMDWNALSAGSNSPFATMFLVVSILDSIEETVTVRSGIRPLVFRRKVHAGPCGRVYSLNLLRV